METYAQAVIRIETEIKKIHDSARKQSVQEKEEFQRLCNNPKKMLYINWKRKVGHSEHKGSDMFLSELYEDYKKFAHDNWLFDHVIPKDRFCQYLKDEYGIVGDTRVYWKSYDNGEVQFRYGLGDYLRGWNSAADDMLEDLHRELEELYQHYDPGYEYDVTKISSGVFDLESM